MSDNAERWILLVEDDEADVFLAERAFERSGVPARVETAGDGEKALARLRDGDKPALIVTDLKMPRMNGVELLRALKDDPELSHIPAAVLTSSAEARDRDESLRLGAKAFLSKPMMSAEWDAVIAKLRLLLG